MQINQYIDHTLLKPTALIKDIETLCSEALQYNFAAVCVPPPMVKIAKAQLQNSKVKVATVIGFPFGYSAVEAKIAEIILAVIDGVDELDIVINLIALKNSDWQYLANEINHIVPVAKQNPAAGNKVIKIIIETGVLTNEEIIRCCELYGAADIDFVKTSTGFAKEGAKLEQVKLMRSVVPDSVGVKASGGIQSYLQAKEFIEAGADRIGTSSGVKIVSQSIQEHVGNI